MCRAANKQNINAWPLHSLLSLCRPLLFACAYSLTGSFSLLQDAVYELLVCSHVMHIVAMETYYVARYTTLNELIY